MLAKLPKLLPKLPKLPMFGTVLDATSETPPDTVHVIVNNLAGEVIFEQELASPVNVAMIQSAVAERMATTQFRLLIDGQQLLSNDELTGRSITVQYVRLFELDFECQVFKHGIRVSVRVFRDDKGHGTFEELWSRFAPRDDGIPTLMRENSELITPKTEVDVLSLLLDPVHSDILIQVGNTEPIALCYWEALETVPHEAESLHAFLNDVGRGAYFVHQWDYEVGGGRIHHEAIIGGHRLSMCMDARQGLRSDLPDFFGHGGNAYATRA